MDFDEYEYLEKTVESADVAKGANGTASKGKSADKEKRRTEEKEDADDGYKSKRHKSLDGERGKSERSADDRDRANKEKSKDRGDRDRGDRDRSERSHRDRDRDKDRDREHRDRDKERDRDRDRERERERDRDRDRDKEKEHRDGDRRRRSKDTERERDYERDRERESDKRRRSHSRSRDHEIKHDREASRSRDAEKDQRYLREKREKKEEVAEPEADPERDQRTVFAYQISLKADERDVYDFFSRAGKVRDVRLIMDRNTRRSKGVGYIEFYDAMSVPMAIALCGQLLLGQPVMVKPSEAEKNLVQSTSTASSAAGLMGQYPGNARRLYVGNLHYNITEDQLRQVFEPFGAIELVQLPTEPETGHCKGFGFVQYAKLEDARHAQQSLNGLLDLAGRIIKVVPITDQQSLQDPTVAPGELDDDDGGGLSLTARSRTLLMQKLDRTGTVSSIVSTAATSAPFNIPAVAPVIPSLGIPGMVGVVNPVLGAATLAGNIGTIGTPSDCLLLKNMFDPATETEPDFDLDIKEEVQSECAKYGATKHIFVDKNSPGHVYLRFSNIQGAVNAQQSLQGRWFAGKMITVTFMTPQAYEAKFPESK